MLFYRVFSIIVAMIFIPVLLSRMLVKRKHWSIFLERLAVFRLNLVQKNEEKKRTWIHALSVGEVVSAINFVKAYAKENPQEQIIFSVSTRTGYETAQKYFEKNIGLFFFPYDFSFSVLRRIKEVSPRRVILIETDIWPGFLKTLRTLHIPVFLINARLSDRSFRRYLKLKCWFQKVFSSFDKIMAQTEEDKSRFVQLGVSFSRIEVVGNIKFDQDIEPISLIEQITIKKQIGIAEDKKILIAGSTHPGEEELLLDGWNSFLDSNQFCLIIAPRDPDRAKEVEQIFKNKGYSTCLLSIASVSSACHVIVVDSLGKLLELYSISDIAFVGGSLKPFGGHNPLEPAGLKKPVLFGPDMSDFRFPAALLLTSGGGFRVFTPMDIKNITTRLIADSKLYIHAGDIARESFLQNKGAIQRTIGLLEK